MSDPRDLLVWLVTEWRDALQRTGKEVGLW